MEMTLQPQYFTDFYKINHYEQYPKNTSLIFSNFTPRKSRVSGVNGCIFFGEDVIHELLSNWKSFFEADVEQVLSHYKITMKKSLNLDQEWNHIRELHELGALPIAVYSLRRGEFVPSGVPAFVIFNTDPRFYWLPNYLETALSCVVWSTSSIATQTWRFRVLLDHFAHCTSDKPEFVDWQAHDFSLRGLMGISAGITTGLVHLNYFKGTDNVYSAILSEMGGSVPATEHSVMCADGSEAEFETFERLITEIYPSGIISIVSDSYDFWQVIDDFLPRLKDKIMARDGKVVIRPDSGNPVDIICGTKEQRGLIYRLWDIFGGEINSKGYKELDSHIGAIYGDSITPEIAEEVLFRLQQSGFSSTNIVFGVGSYTYQYLTRDTFGWAFKTTYAEVDGVGRSIYKDPKTDDGTKKSAKGLLKVIKNDKGDYELKQEVTWEEFYQEDNQLKLIFKDGKEYAIPDFDEAS